MQSPFLEFYRASLRSAADAMSASLERSVRLQERQLDLLNAQMQGATQFWVGVWRAAGDAQRSIMGPIEDELATQEPESEEQQEPQSEDQPEDQPEPEEALENAADPTELAAAQISRAVGQARRRAAG